MLKDKIYGYHEVLGNKEYDSLDEVVKDYFLLWVNHHVNNFNYLLYRGCDLKILDGEGKADYYEIKYQLSLQIDAINLSEGL